MVGGPGSGNFYRWDARGKVENYHSIDIREWSRRGFLQPGRWFLWAWYGPNGAATSTISVRVDENLVALDYGYGNRARPDREKVSQYVDLTWTPCHFGGRRVWFRCPGVVNGHLCNRRVAILYIAGPYFLCRECYDLTYKSTCEPERDRLLHQAQKIRRRLGGSGSIYDRFPSKPKGMHWRTYQQLCEQALDYEARALNMVDAYLARFSSVLDRYDPL